MEIRVPNGYENFNRISWRRSSGPTSGARSSDRRMLKQLNDNREHSATLGTWTRFSSPFRAGASTCGGLSTRTAIPWTSSFKGGEIEGPPIASSVIC